MHTEIMKELTRRLFLLNLWNTLYYSNSDVNLQEDSYSSTEEPEFGTEGDSNTQEIDFSQNLKNLFQEQEIEKIEPLSSFTLAFLASDYENSEDKQEDIAEQPTIIVSLASELSEPQPFENHKEESSYIPPPFKPKSLEEKKYEDIVRPYSHMIMVIAERLQRIRERQYYKIPQPSYNHSLLPENGELQRFDPSAHQRLMTRIATGQKIEEKDLHRFHKDSPMKNIPAPLDMIIIIDGSGSMMGAPINHAIAASAILYEAAKRVKFDVYIYAMEAYQQPKVIAKPGDNYSQIGKAIIEVISDCRGDKDCLMPALPFMLKTLQNRKNMQLDSPVGMSHVFVISDGFFSDKTQSIKVLSKMIPTSPHMTFDFALLSLSGRSNIEYLQDNLPKEWNIGFTDIDKAEQLPTKLIELLTNRLAKTSEHKTTTYSNKINEISRTLKIISNNGII